MFQPVTNFDFNPAPLPIPYLVISEMFGSYYVEIGIPEKRAIYYLGIVWSPTSDEEARTG